MEFEVERLHKKIGSLYTLIEKLIKENKELKKQLIKSDKNMIKS